MGDRRPVPGQRRALARAVPPQRRQTPARRPHPHRPQPHLPRLDPAAGTARRPQRLPAPPPRQAPPASAHAQPVALALAATLRQHAVPIPGQHAPAAAAGRGAPAVRSAHRDLRSDHGRCRAHPRQHPAPPPLPPPARPARHRAAGRPAAAGRHHRPAPRRPPRPARHRRRRRGPDTGTSPVIDPYLDPYADTSPGPGQHGGSAPASSPVPQPEPPGPRPAGGHRRAARPRSPARFRSASAGPARPPSTSPPSAGWA